MAVSSGVGVATLGDREGGAGLIASISSSLSAAASNQITGSANLAAQAAAKRIQSEGTAKLNKVI